LKRESCGITIPQLFCLVPAHAEQSDAHQSAFGIDPYLNWIDLRQSCPAGFFAAKRRHRKHRQT
jgi:hypothetical protein